MPLSLLALLQRFLLLFDDLLLAPNLLQRYYQLSRAGGCISMPSVLKL